MFEPSGVECNPLGDYVKNAIILPTPYDAVPAPYGMILNYRCLGDYQFRDAVDVEGEYIRMSSCNGTGMWDPAPVTCIGDVSPDCRHIQSQGYLNYAFFRTHYYISLTHFPILLL